MLNNSIYFETQTNLISIFTTKKLFLQNWTIENINSSYDKIILI